MLARLALLSLAALAPFAAFAQAEAPVAVMEGPAAKAAPEAPRLTPGYTRLVREKDGVFACEIAARTLRPETGDGPAVTLVGAIHIGTADYYAALQRELEAHDIVLFEGVADDPAKFRDKRKPGKAPKRDAYASMAKALGLVTQMSALDYDRKHFVHADLSMKRMREMLEAEVKAGGEAGAEAGMALINLGLLDSMLSGGGFLSGLMDSAVARLESDRLLQADTLLRMAVAEKETQPLSKFWPGAERLQRLILEDRNTEVMRRLAEQMAKKPGAPRTLAIFYGAAHLRDLEKRLTRDLGYRFESDRWIRAFDVNPAAAGLAPDAIADLTRGAVEPARP